MGNVPACSPAPSIDEIGLFELVNTYACDIYSVPHIVNVFWVAIITRDAWNAWVIAGVFELAEVLMQVIVGSYSFFIGPEGENVENFGRSLVEDWLIQGGIGALLGLVYIASFPGPRMLRFRDLFRLPSLKVGRFILYSLLLIIIAGVGTMLFGYELADSGFKLGVFFSLGLTVFVVAGLFCFKAHKKTWQSYSSMQQWEYWLTTLVFTTVISVQAAFDYLYSGAIQSWLWSFVFLVYLFVRALYRYRVYGYVHSPEGYDPFKTD
jgi:hypothetical protein